MRKIRRAALAVACILFACGVLLSFGGCAEHGASTDSPAASPIIIGISVPRSEEAPVTNALLSIQNNLKPEEEIILKDAEGSNDKQEADIIELADQEIDDISDLIDLSGVSRGPINKLYRNQQVDTVKLGTLLRLCDALGCKLSDLVEYSPEE